MPVSITGGGAAVAQQVRTAGGHVLVDAAGTSVAVVPRAKLRQLAAASGVGSIGLVNHPYQADAPSVGTNEGVAASNADLFHQTEHTGQGTRIAIIDAGFGESKAEYDSEVSAGHLGSSPQLVNEDCVDDKDALTPHVDKHGLAVAEIAAQEAPDTQLFLYCVGSPQGVVKAEAAVEAAGITLVSSSLVWFDDSRGDGTGAAGSVAATVRKARQHGVLWVNAAGNEVDQHYSGKLADVDNDGYLDIGNADESVYPYESNFYTVAPETDGVPSNFDWILQWDNWPTTMNQVTLQGYGVQCTAAFGSGGTDDCQGTDLTTISHASVRGQVPSVTLSLYADGQENTTGFPQIWEVAAKFDTGFTKGARYDLFGEGDALNASDLSCPTGDAQGNCIFSSAARNGSIPAPGNSPYAFAVGAADVGADGTPKATLEYFSSQGPTIDGRIKPEITGWDGVTSTVYGGPFYGTSAATPGVAGSLALVQQAALDRGQSLDAAQLEYLLEQRAGSGHPANPPNDQTGHGLLTLVSSPVDDPVTAPAGSRYTGITPTRLLDTRTTTGGHKGVVAAGKTVTVKVSTSIPAGATAVAVNLTGTGATATTYLSSYPGGTAAPPASNLNLSKTDPTAAVFAVVRLNANRTVTVINNAGNVNVVLDEVGYFAPGDGPGLYDPLTSAARILDTRTTTGGHKGKLAAGKSVTVTSGSGAGQVAAIVNVTATNVGGTGYLSTGATCGAKTSTLNFTKYTRANLAVVQLTDLGKFCITAGGHATDVAVDVVGYMGTTGAEFHALPSATRIVDTRTGNGGAGGGHSTSPLGAAEVTPFYGAGVGDVPADSTALLTGVVEASTTTGQYLALFPGTTKPASVTSNLNFSTGRVVPNAAIVSLSTDHRFGAYNNAGSTNVAIDLFGYFSPRPAG